MQKLTLFVLFIACVISAHAFVKRDAPAAASPNYIEDIQNQFKTFVTQINDTIAKNLDPEEIKKQFSTLVDNAKKTMDTFKPKEGA